MRSLILLPFVLAQAQGTAVPPPAALRQGPVLVAEEVFKATVTAVDDGDTLQVKTAAERVTIHLEGVDAPEMAQPGGPEAKSALSDMAFGKAITVRLKNAAERLARVEVDGADVSEALIRRGMAWHCPRFTNDRKLSGAEAEARSAKRGLWSAARPTPPWLFRGAGSCWEAEKKRGTRSDSTRPDFSGTWRAVSPADRAGERLTITQDAARLTLARSADDAGYAATYKLNGSTSLAFSGSHGPVDIVAKTRWKGSTLVIEERRWLVRGEEATSVRQALWIDDRGFLNLEISKPRPIGEEERQTIVFSR